MKFAVGDTRGTGQVLDRTSFLSELAEVIPVPARQVIMTHDIMDSIMLRALINRSEYHTAADRIRLAAIRLQQWQRKYRPDQPRAPAGVPEGGQWILVDGTAIKVAGPWNDVNRPKCNAQYEGDMFQCSFARAARSRAACEDQGMTRFVSCMKDNPVPPHIYYLGDSR